MPPFPAVSEVEANNPACGAGYGGLGKLIHGEHKERLAPGPAALSGSWDHFLPHQRLQGVPEAPASTESLGDFI